MYVSVLCCLCQSRSKRKSLPGELLLSNILFLRACKYMLLDNDLSNNAPKRSQMRAFCSAHLEGELLLSDILFFYVFVYICNLILIFPISRQSAAKMRANTHTYIHTYIHKYIHTQIHITHFAGELVVPLYLARVYKRVRLYNLACLVKA
jgi:hypothetical protein